MKPEIKTAWVKALRSDEYKQCQHVLGADNTNCCLGVLAAVVNKEFPEIMRQAKCSVEFEKANGNTYMFLKTSQGFEYSTDLPDNFLSLVDMSVGQMNKCVAWNDLNLLDFPNIANKIEEIL